MGCRKGSRKLRTSENVRLSRTTKRKQPKSANKLETDQESFSASAKKIKLQEGIEVPQADYIEYRILNFITVFAVISNYVKCKVCNSDVEFQTTSMRGLGFIIVIKCNTCQSKFIPSCPYIGTTYEINRQFIFTMKVLGLGLKGCQKFCGLMDIPQFLCHSTYDIILKHIHSCVDTVCQYIMKKAVKQEVKKSCEERNIENTCELTVSGDGTWKKRGFTSLYGVSSVIGYYTGKVLDVHVKSAYCKMCEFWNKKKGTTEYEEWLESHQSECSANHEGSAGKMEVDAITEMFQRSQQRYNVKYVNYIGDGDSKTYTGIVNALPYGEHTRITKKECIGHVQKRMGTRLRGCKKKTKGLGGKGKLTAKMIDKLTIYYGLAIRRNCNSVDEMKKAIWAIYDHYSSTDEQPKHRKCPPGADSWCSWQRASASGQLASYKHDYKALPIEVLNAIKPIYKDLSSENLLERCVGGFTQNNNESFNQIIWKISPKIYNEGSTAVEIASYIATCLFNEGATSFLKIFQALGIHSGPNIHMYATREDAERIRHAEDRARKSTQEARQRRRQEQVGILEAATDAEGLLYGPGIDDSV